MSIAKKQAKTKSDDFKALLRHNAIMTDELIVKAFESIGIPKMQTVVYLDLLKNKKSTATRIAKRTEMHRTNVYDTLTKLKERNLVYLSYKEGKQVYAALTTDLILNQEKEKLESIKSAMNYINTTYVTGQTPKVYTLEGLDAVKSIILGLLEKKSTIWIYGLAENENMINLLNSEPPRPKGRGFLVSPLSQCCLMYI